jgi:hypothetical protein
MRGTDDVSISHYGDFLTFSGMQAAASLAETFVYTGVPQTLKLQRKMN